MLNSSKKIHADTTDKELTEQEEELEHFDDFTLASSWERFISKIEAVLRVWMSDGPKNLLEKGAVLLEDAGNLYKVKSEMKYAMKSYCMEFYFMTDPDGKLADWNFDLHDLQLCFGVKEFLVIAPQSASGVILDAPESSKLLSAIAIALSNCSSLWPAFVPVHDPSRKAYIGIQSMGTVFTRRFEADRIGSQVPVKLMHLEGLYELFVSKFAYSTLDLSVHNFKVRCAMKLTFRTLPYDDDNMKDAKISKSGENLTGPMCNGTQWDDDCSWSEWYSAEDPVKGFELIAIWSEKMVESSMEMAELENASPHEAEKWLISLRLEGSSGNRVGFASELCLLVDALQVSFEAQFMEDFVSAVENPGSDNLKSMVIPPPTVRDRETEMLSIQQQGADSWVWRADPSGSYSTKSAYAILLEATRGDADNRPFVELWKLRIPPKAATFAWRLIRNRLPTKTNLRRRLVEISDVTCPLCNNMEEDASHLFFHCSRILPLWWESLRWVGKKTAFPQNPIEHFMQRTNGNADFRHNLSNGCRTSPIMVMAQSYGEGLHYALQPMVISTGGGVQFSDFADSRHKTSRAIKGAPLGSLFAQFCLHSLWFGNCNIRAIAVLWIEFVREVRWCWEESQLLSRMPANGSIDLSTCLINQKLQMLAICIERKCQLNEDYQDCIGSLDQIDFMSEEESVVGDDSFSLQTPSEDFFGKVDRKPEDLELLNEKKSSDLTRRGSAGIVDSMMLLKSHQSMHVPYTQEVPLMTEDMHEDRLKAVEAFGDSFDFSAQLERDILTSAFKAANPDAVFEDFIRWHSPGDWEEDDDPEGSKSSSSSALDIKKSKDSWPPQGQLSKRMSEQGNLWRKLWNSAPALPASEQKPLLDPNREGEKVLHYLETLQPHELLEQMVCTAFKAAADTLCQTSYGELKQVETEMQQLYLTMASALRPLQVNRLSGDSEIVEDLRRLTIAFEQVEKLLALAASLHRKLIQAPRVSREIFNNYYNFYIQTTGKGLIEDIGEKEFNKKQEVKDHEREVLSNMFVPPTANQSWRKVLSMGNLLNGHEPILREIILSLRDRVSGNHYAARSGSVSQQEIETYRMYICGTSNDLRVALSVVSCD
ncbi:Rab3 GTPase-activating protein catalytic subunit [Glycine soja]